MNYWLISDTHFNHTKLEEWGNRSGNWQDQIWNGLRLIPGNETLIHLGDICIGDDLEIHNAISSLICKKILVKGNHDKKSTTWYYDHGWDFVVDGFELLYNGHYLYFSHRPIYPFSHITWNIHGHTHGNMHRSEEYYSFYSPQFHIDLSPELVGYSPISLNSLMKSKSYSKLPLIPSL